MEKELRIKLNTISDLKGVESVKRSFSELERESLRVAASQRNITSSTSDAARSVDDLSERIGFMGHAYVGFQTIVATSSFMADITKDAIAQADTWNLLEGRLRLVTDSTQQLVSVQADLFDIAQESRTSYESNADLYARIARATQDMNKSQYETLDVTEAISKSFIVSGAASESAKAAVIQLGQGFASGTLRGEELNSVLEQAPRLAEAIADGMGVSVGKLKDMGAEGKLTAEKVYEAIRTQKDAIEKEFDQMPKTVSQSLVVLTNQIGLTIHEFDQMHGATAGIAEAISGITVVLSEHSGEIGDYIGYVGGAVVAILAWKAGTIALNGIQAAHAAYVAASTVATTSYSIATNTTTTAVTTLTARQVAANAAVGAWNKLIAINPYAIAGAAIVGVGLVLKDQADQLRDSVRRTAVDVENLSAKALQAKISYGTMQLDAVNRSIEDPSFMKSVFGNERIDLHRKAQLENELKAYGKQLQKLHEEASKPSSNNSGGDKQDPLSDKELKKIEALKEKQKRAAEQLTKLNHDLNDEIFKATASEHEKAMKLIDDGVNKYRDGGADKIKIAQLVSLKQEEYLEAEYAKAVGQFDALDKETAEKTKTRLNISEDMYIKLNDISGNWYDNELLNAAKWYNDQVEKGADIVMLNEVWSKQISAIDKKRLDEQNELSKKQLEEQNVYWDDLFSNINKAMESQFFDAMTGRFESFGSWLKDMWASITDSMARGLSKTLADYMIGGVKGGIQNIFSGFGLFGASTVGTTLSASDIASIGGTVGEAFTTPGGTSISAEGQILSGGSDLISLSSSLSTLKDLAMGGLYTPSAYIGQLAGTAYGAGFTGTGSFLGGVSNAFAGGSASGLSGAAFAGNVLGAGALGGLGGYAMGSIGDKLFGADTRAANYGATGGAIGAMIGSVVPVVGTLVGGLIGSAIGSIIGGFQGKDWISGQGYKINSATSSSVNGQRWAQTTSSDWGGKDVTNYFASLKQNEIDVITAGIKSYETILKQMNIAGVITVTGGLYTSLNDFVNKGVSKAFIDAVTDADTNTIYKQWSAYAKSIKATVSEAIGSAVSSYVGATRSFKEWQLGSGTVAQQEFTSKYLADDLQNLASSMGVAGVTAENFLSMYQDAIKESFTPETIEKWNTLGEAIKKATDANNSYTESLKASTAFIPTDMMLQKTGATKTAVDIKQLVNQQGAQTEQTAQLVAVLTETVKVLKKQLTIAQIGNNQGIPA